MILNRNHLDTRTLKKAVRVVFVGHYVSSPREREKRNTRDSRGNEREGQGRKRKMNESEETEE